MNEAAFLLYALTGIMAMSLGWDGFKNRYLPIARPFTVFAYLMAIFAGLRALELFEWDKGQLIGQALLDFDFLLASLVYPIWVWMLLEYQQERKVAMTDFRILLFLIHPVLQFLLVVFDMVAHGYLSQASSVALINPEQRLGSYVIVRYIYAWSTLLLLTVLTPYLMIKKQQHTISDVVKIVVLTPLPFAFFALHKYGVTEYRLTVVFMTLYLFWISRQYRLLDVMPLALRGVMDNVNSGILVSNAQAKLLFVNECANKLLNLDLSPETLKRREQDIPEKLKQCFDFSSPKKQEAQLEIEGSHQGAPHRHIDAVLQPILHPKTQRHLGATLSLHDVTERKNTELQLQRFDRQKSEFFAGISHEFRTPLTLSLGNLDDVLEDAERIKPAELKAALSSVKHNNQRLLALVNQLLELSRLEAGSLPIKPTLLHLDSYLPPLIANFESQASRQRCHIHLQFNHHTAQQSALYFDADAFDKVMLNLISNALKSMPEGGDVTIQLGSPDDATLQLSVRDTGCGIPADALDKVFEMFYSHEHSNPAWQPGTGVGLSLVKQLLKRHGADIQVESVEGQGSTFTITFRKGYAHFPPELVVQHQSNAALAADKYQHLLTLDAVGEPVRIDNDAVLMGFERNEVSEKLVLLVDDNAEMRAYIRKHLAIHFRLIEAADGEEGLALAREAMPDLVLSDVMMPKMNGYELCRELKSHPQTSHIPVLLLTAKSSHNEKLEGLELGADDYLSKPFDVRELTLRMNNLIASRRTIQAFYQHHGLQKVICHPELPKRETSFLDTLQKYVEANIGNADIKVADLAEAVHMSERSLNRKLKALTGDTPKNMVLVIRLEYAKKILTHHPDEPVTQVAYQAGFADASHFTRSFKAYYAMTPTKFREQNAATP